MHDAREDGSFVIPRGGQGHAIYFRRQEFAPVSAPTVL